MATCSVCVKPFKVNADSVCRNSRTFHTECIKLLDTCPKCRLVMLNSDDCQQVCLDCGWNKKFYMCSTCDSAVKTEGVIRNGDILCSSCDKRSQGLQRCFSGHWYSKWETSCEICDKNWRDFQDAHPDTW